MPYRKCICYIYHFSLAATNISWISFVCKNVSGDALYYFLIKLLTADRFLVFYLNIKYPIFYTPNKFLEIIYSIVVIVTTCFHIIRNRSFTKTDFLYIDIKILFVFIFLVSVSIFVVITYTYIFVVYKRHMKLKKNPKLDRRIMIVSDSLYHLSQ